MCLDAITQPEPGQHWEDVKNRFPVGLRVRGTVIDHQPYGIFVDLGEPEVRGLVQITEFPDSERMTIELYPPVGAEIEAIVLGHRRADSRQIWLGMNPSQLEQGG